MDTHFFLMETDVIKRLEKVLNGSISREPEMKVVPPSLIFRPTLENYKTVLTPEFKGFIVNSLQVTIATIAISIVLGLLAAYAIVLGNMAAKKADNLVSTNLLPPVGVVIPIYLLLKSAHTVTIGPNTSWQSGGSTAIVEIADSFSRTRTSSQRADLLIRLTAMVHPEGVSREEGEEWFLNVHAQDVIKQPKLYRFFSYRVIKEPLTLSGTWPPGAI